MKTVSDTAKFLNVSYRQLNHWIKIGHLKEATGSIGTGNQQWLRWPEIRKAELISELLSAGFTLSGAAALASGDRAAIEGVDRLLPKCREVAVTAGG